MVVFADLSTGMVLAADTAERTTQEKLDAMCSAARFSLLGPSAQIAGKFLSSDMPDYALVPDLSELQLFIRAAHPAQEALCVVAPIDVECDAVLAQARDLLSRVTAEVS